LRMPAKRTWKARERETERQRERERARERESEYKFEKKVKSQALSPGYFYRSAGKRI